MSFQYFSLEFFKLLLPPSVAELPTPYPYNIYLHLCTMNPINLFIICAMILIGMLWDNEMYWIVLIGATTFAFFFELIASTPNQSNDCRRNHVVFHQSHGDCRCCC